MSKGAESPQDCAQGKSLPEAWREEELVPGPLCALCAVVVKRVMARWGHARSMSVAEMGCIWGWRLRKVQILKRLLCSLTDTAQKGRDLEVR